jgi:hypothetical protein
MPVRLACLGAALALLAAAAPAAPAAAAERRVPVGWLGVTADGPMTADREGEWDRMVDAGVETVRTSMRWYKLQPYRTAAEVPAAEAPRFQVVNGVPTDLSSADAMVIAAARRRIGLLPVVESPPGWAALRPGDPASPPGDLAAVRGLLATLVGRYGPGGSLWRARPDLPRLPIRAWQIFNEPNITMFWSEKDFAESYVRTLSAAEQGVHAVDPDATVVLAGLTYTSWTALRAIYEAGGRGLFDAVAVHPYTARPADVMRIVRYDRAVMRAYGDRLLPIWITEFGWTASRGRVPNEGPFVTTDALQARNLARVLRRFFFARHRARITRVFWYTWLSPGAGPSPWDWAGLRRISGGGAVDTPALSVFRRRARRLEGCAKAAGDAGRCA